MVVVRCMLYVVHCLWLDVSGMLNYFRRLLFVGCCSMFVVRCLLFVVCCLWFVGVVVVCRCFSCVVCCMLFVVCCLLFVVC